MSKLEICDYSPKQLSRVDKHVGGFISTDVHCNVYLLFEKNHLFIESTI